jgi:TonB family protein
MISFDPLYTQRFTHREDRDHLPFMYRSIYLIKRLPIHKMTLGCLGILLAITFSLTASANPSPSPSAEPSSEASPPAGALTRAPTLLHLERAVYPQGAKEAKVSASVTLLITIGVDGAVIAAEVQTSAQSDFPFDQNATEALKRSRFTPAEIDHVPSEIQFPFQYEFNLEDELARERAAKRPKPQAEGDDPAPTGVLTRAPELINFIEAVYPEEAKAKGVGATVLMLLTLDEMGKVTEVEIESTTERAYPFDKNAEVAAQQFTFRPAEVDGEPASVKITYKYEFEIKEEVKTVEVNREVGRLSGLILERGTRRPILGVRVRLIDRDESVFTDETGAFLFDNLTPGKVKIEADSDAHYTLLDLEEITAKRETEVKYYLEPKVGGDDSSITVVGRRAKKEVAKRTLTMEEIRKIPGTQGDALKVVQNLPGVARIPFGGGGLVVRGSNPGDSGSMINRHFIPLIFHFGGIRSIFPSELLETIDFYPGNFSSEFGRFTGGVVDARFRRPESERWKARLEADVFDAGFLVQGPISENATIALSGRRSYIDAILPAVLPDDGALDFVVAPRYYDYQALFDWKKGRHRLRLYFFGSDDELLFVLNEPSVADPAVRGDFKNSTSLMRGYAAWDLRISPTLSHHLSIASGQNGLFFALGEELYFKNDVNIITLRDELKWKPSPRLTLRGGVEGEAYLGRISIQLPAPQRKEGQAGMAPLGTLDLLEQDRDFQFYNPALWIEAQWRPTEKLLLIPGARLDYDYYLSDLAPDPRLNFRYTLYKDQEGDPKGTLKGGVGRYSQRPSPDETDTVFGNPGLTLEHSAHFSLGYEHRFTEAINVDLIGFYKHLYGSVSPTDSILRYNNDGEGRVYGLELLLRHNLTSRFFGWMSYTLMRSERKDSGEDDYRLFSLDQTHIFTLIAQYKFSPQWELGLRYRYTTGNPRTPYVSAIYDSDADAYVPIPGAVNSERINAFQQIDLRVDRKWIFDRWMLTLYFEIQNALNQSNPEGIRYNYNFTQSQPITGLPIIPSIGLRGEL